MSIQSLSNKGQSSVASATAVANATQTDQQAIDAFVQALGQAVSFQPMNSMPTLAGILNKAVAAQPAPLPAQPQSQSNDQPQQQNSSGPNVVQSGQNGPVQTQTVQKPSGPQTKTAASASNTDQTRSASDHKSDQTTAAVDPTADQTVMAVVAQQIVPTAQPVEHVQTVTVASTDAGTQQANTGEQAAVQTGPVGPAVPVEQTGPQTGQQTVKSATPANQGQTKDLSPAHDDFAMIRQGLAQSTMKAQSGKIAAATEQTTTVTQQANDLANSLYGTGASLSINVSSDVNAKNAATTVDDTTADPTNVPPAIIPVVPSNANPNASASSQNNGDQLQADQSSLGGLDLRQTALDNQAQNSQAFNAVLAAQMENNKPEPQAAPAPQGINTVTAVGGTQATQKAQAAQAPQAPTPPRMPQQAQVMDQVSVQISKQAKDGVDNIKVQLRPEELGRIEIKLEVSKDGSVQATITAENKDTLAMLQKDADGLAKALSDAGLNADAGSMNFNLRGDGQQQFAGDSNSQNGNNGSNRGGNGLSSLASLLGGEDDAAATAALAAQSSRSALSAVNIQV